jgi:XTP/dITP diphosphohydrolase
LTHLYRMRGRVRAGGYPVRPFNQGQRPHQICYPTSLLRIVAATRNKKKLEELRRILEGVERLELLGLDIFPDVPEVEETGATFEENAVLKAKGVAKHVRAWVLADDSGLEVEALGGRPGVYSARYAGPDATDEKNVQKLLKELEKVPTGERTARFRAVIALATPCGDTLTFSGKVEGRIGEKPKGNKGFGYDPVFYPVGYDRTFAEMEAVEKDSMSHRSEALKKLKEYFEKVSKDFRN